MLNRSNASGAAWRVLSIATYPPGTKGVSMAFLDEIDAFRTSCEERPVDALLRMESLQRKTMSSNRTWSDYPDALVGAKFATPSRESTTFRRSYSRLEREA